jgi:hypothetical protein
MVSHANRCAVLAADQHLSHLLFGSARRQSCIQLLPGRRDRCAQSIAHQTSAHQKTQERA